MRLLLDECVPRPLLRDLTEHDAHKELRPLVPRILVALGEVRAGTLVTVRG
jgi:hypothetical protein